MNKIRKRRFEEFKEQFSESSWHKSDMRKSARLELNHDYGLKIFKSKMNTSFSEIKRTK